MLFETPTLPSRTTGPVVSTAATATPTARAPVSPRLPAPPPVVVVPTQTISLATLAGGALLIIWAFFSTIGLLVDKWIADPQYSHGFLVPLFSLYLLRRAVIETPATSGLHQWYGLRQVVMSVVVVMQAAASSPAWRSTPRPIIAIGLLVIAFGLRLLSGGLLFIQLDAFALMLSLTALAFAMGGSRMARVTAPAVIFLIFMVPLPYELERNVGGPLKIIATESSVFFLQTIGYPAVAEGNVILIDEVRLGVIDACSGLKMLVTFSAFAFGAVLILDRTWFEKFLVVLGVVPIAVITNVLRITATGVVYTLTNDKAIQTNAHEYFGFAMMPVGLGLLALQLWVLGRLVVQPKTMPVEVTSYRTSATPLPA